MLCKMCKERGQNWSGDAPTCYFDDRDGNWNCATINAIRDICDDWGEGFPDGIYFTFCDDEKYAVIKIDEIDTEDWIGYCLYVQWYKHRGHTDALWILGEGNPSNPTEEELLAILKYYKPLLPQEV